MLYFVKPNVEINGHRNKPNWGQFIMDLVPGEYHVHVSFPWVFGDRTGPSQMQVPIYSGYVTMVKYEAPLFLLNDGSLRMMGRQPMPGVQALPPAY